MLGIVLYALYRLPYSVLLSVVESRFYHAYFMDEEAETQSG